MQSSSPDHFCLFVSDSRGNNFDRYTQPRDLNIHYVIQRGATIEKLTFLSRNALFHHSPTNHVIVKIAAGINDILTKTNGPKGTLVQLADVSADDIIQKLLTFRSVIKIVAPTALVGFATIPTASLHAIQQHNIQSNKIETAASLSDEILDGQQQSLNDLIKQINREIRSLNSVKQSFCVRGCWTISWHNLVSKDHTKRSAKGRAAKKHTRYTYSNLYDGLHGTSTTKKAWFEQVLIAFRGELSFIRKEQSHSISSYDQVSSSESESDWLLDTSDKQRNTEDTPWKRRR